MYCCVSEDNARTFYEDAIRDTNSAMDIPDTLIKAEERESFKETREQLLRRAAEDGIDNPRKYTHVAEIAKLMKYQHFAKVNMTLSKWAHPTALSVIGSESGVILNKLFYDHGTGWTDTSLQNIANCLGSVRDDTFRAVDP